MKTQIKSKINRKIILFPIIGIIVIVVVFKLLMAFYYSGYFGFKITDTPNNTKIFTNKVYSLEYPQSYKPSIGGDDGNNRLWLDNEEVWGDEYDGYPLIKGMFMIAEYKENVDLTESANYETEHWDNKRTKTKKIKNVDGLEVTSGYEHPLKVPSHIQVFIKNKNDVFSISFIVGDKITRDEYNQYLNEFNTILASIIFLK